MCGLLTSEEDVILARLQTDRRLQVNWNVVFSCLKNGWPQHRGLATFISHETFFKSSCKSQFPHKFVNLSCM